MTHKVEIMMIDRTLAATPMPSKLKNVPAVIVIQWAEIPRTAKDKTRTRPRNWHWETRLFVKHGGRTEDDATGLMKCHVRHSMARKECKKIRIRSWGRETEGKQKRRNGQRKKTGMWLDSQVYSFYVAVDSGKFVVVNNSHSKWQVHCHTKKPCRTAHQHIKVRPPSFLTRVLFLSFKRRIRLKL